MKISFISDTGLTLGLAMRCAADGHDVNFLTEALVGEGLISKHEEVLASLTIFDTNSQTRQADKAREEGFRVLGPSRWSSMLESDANYRNRIIASLGFSLNGITQGTNFYITAWFNGDKFIASYASIIYKRFMPGGAGPDLSCTGMLGCFRDISQRTKDTFLAPLEDMLRQVKHQGPVHIHALIHEDNFCVRSITASFASPLSLLLYENTNLSASAVLLRVSDPKSESIPIIDSWASGMQISVPPYPYGQVNGTVYSVSNIDLKHFWLVDVNFRAGRYHVSNRGLMGYVTTRGRDENECVRRMYHTVSNLKLLDVQYRNDVGRNVQGMLYPLRRFKWLN